MQVAGSVRKHEMHSFPVCLEGDLHSLWFLYLPHLWVLVAMDGPREFGQDAACHLLHGDAHESNDTAFGGIPGLWSKVGSFVAFGTCKYSRQTAQWGR